MNTSNWIVSSICAVLIVAAVSCELDSADSVTRSVNIIVSGFYTNPNGNLVARNSGNAIVNMNLIQDGDQLQGIDNNGNKFSGTIGSVNDANASASIVMKGPTTAGKEGTIAATISVSGGTATMQGTWIEDGITSTVYAQNDEVPNQGISITASSSEITSGDTSTLTASGGTGNYDWDKEGASYGSLTASGATAIFTADTVTASVTQVISVNDDAGNSASTSIKINP